MGLFEGKTPAERNKLIAGIVLPLVVLFLLVRMFFSGPSRPQTTVNVNANANRTTAGARPGQPSAPLPPPEDLFADLRPIVALRGVYGVPEASRNIFAFYEPPPPPAPKATAEAPPATPTPTPPMLITGLSPSNVYARTGNFTLQVTGDKFTPAARLYLEGQEQQTQYRSPQQLSVIVNAALITGPGPRRVEARTPDGQLYSNTATLNVMQPPAPTYTYVGLLGRTRANTAVLKDQKGELYSVRAGDLVEGRFRVTNITETGVEVVDKDLHIKHTLAYVESRTTGGPVGRVPGSIQPPPPPKEEGGEEEP